MRAAITTAYGAADVVRVQDVATPDPGKGQVLVQVLATAVTAGDARIRGARFPRGFGTVARLIFGLRRPRKQILGTVFSGTIEALGPGVEGWSVGQEVCGMTGAALGAHAQFLAVPAKQLAVKPETVSHEQAAGMLFGGTTALFFLRDKAKVTAGQQVLVIGASGAVGTNAVQLAKYFGAHVTAVTSAANDEMVRELGADEVIDYRTTDVAGLDRRWDVVLDAVGTLTAQTGKQLLNPDGTLLLLVADMRDTIGARGKVKAGSAPERAADFVELLGLVADGRLRAVIDSTFTLDQIAQAHARVDTGHKVGNVIVKPWE